MRLGDIETPSPDALIFYVLIEEPTTEELGEFDRICRKTSKFDDWDTYGQLIDGNYILVLANRNRRFP